MSSKNLVRFELIVIATLALSLNACGELAPNQVSNLSMSPEGDLQIVDDVDSGHESDPGAAPEEAMQPQPKPPVVSTPAPTPKPPVQNTAGVLFHAKFDSHSVGSKYSLEKARVDFGAGVPSIAKPDLGQIVAAGTGGNGNALRTTYLAGQIGGESVMKFNVDLNKNYEELYFAFSVKFDRNFDFVKGGKIPGLCGGNCNSGGSTPNGYDGWSVRMMWGKSGGKQGAMYQYIYHVDQPTIYGDDRYYNIGGQRYFERDRWYKIQYRVKMNTPGQKNGIVQAWVDGSLVLDIRNMRFRNTNAFAIDKFAFSTFFGGGDSSWAPTKTEYIYWDDMIVATGPIAQ